MDFKLTREQKRLRKDFVCFAQEHHGEEPASEEEGFSRELWQKCGEINITGLHVPEAFGGPGYDATTVAIALEGLGAGGTDGSMLTTLSAHLFSVLSPLMEFGTEKQKSMYLSSLGSGTLLGASAMTEEGAGTRFMDLGTTATQEDEHFVLQGKKTFCINAPEADLFLIYAKTDKKATIEAGLTCFIVENGTAGVTVEQVEKQLGSANIQVGHVLLDQVRISQNAVLGGIGKGGTVFNHASQWERSLLGSMYVGRLEHLLNACINEARTRKEGDLQIGKTQSVSHAITDIKIRLEVSRLLSRKAAWALSQTQTNTSSAPISKLFTSESILRSVLDAVQIFGDYSILKTYQLENTLQDALDSNFLAGNSQSQRRAIARSLGL